MTKEKVLNLANHISRKKRGAKDEIKSTDPEYLILEPVVSDDMADVAMCMKIRQKYTAKDIAPVCGKTEEDVEKLLWELAVAGVCFVNKIDGVDTYWYDTWVPGIMEMMVNNKENVKKYPQIAEAFEAYGRVRGPKTAGAFPVGVGLMRVIPIEKAIDGETRRASYEEVSKYLNDNEIFTVSDCSCRAAREAMGEGCGHLKEDMCIQMGHAAEYYIRTGRGRQISREEAFEIIKRAEENGLMHQIPNLDGSGKTHAICNCCGCSCLSLRTAGMFKNVDMVRSNYVSSVDSEKCTACGKCVETCPVNALKLGQKICSTQPLKVQKQETPRDTEWGPEKWNPEYRTNRKAVMDTGTSPCKTECPAHIGIQGYIKLAAQGRYKEALELIKSENPFPAVCGRICPRKCESECTRGDIDDPVAIDEIKKFIAAQDLNSENRFIPKKKNEFENKIAVIGSGPAGLTCAYYLAVEGYKVTLFEKEKSMGGMMTMGIPAFRLEKDVVDSEIEILKELGVEFKTGVEIGKDLSLEDLRAKGFEAFYIALGAQSSRKLGVEGEDSKGVIPGIDFLKNVNQGIETGLSGKTVVIGGGNVAIDVARCAVRKSGVTVDMFCLEKLNEMPALNEEIEEALGEGISINNSWGPKRVISKDGKVTGVEFKRCVSVFDGNGRFNPEFEEEDTITVECDTLLLSIGQSFEYGNIFEGSKVEFNTNGTIKADSFTYQTAEADVFAGGDMFTGPRFAIDAIAAGKQGAESIHRFVQPGQSLVIGRDRREYKALDKKNLVFEGYDNIPRQRHETSDTFTMEQVEKETMRCLSCGATVVDEFLCVGCGSCTTKCRFDAISLVRVYDGEGVAFEDLKPVVVKHILKRKGKIMVKNIKNTFVRN